MEPVLHVKVRTSRIVGYVCSVGFPARRLMRSQRVCLLIDSLGSGGAQRQILILAGQLADSGYQVSLLTYHTAHELDYMLDSRIQFVCISKRATGLCTFVYRFYRQLRRLKPDALIAYLPTPSLLGRTLGRVAGVKTIITSQRNDDLDKSRRRLFLERLTCRFSTAIVSNSRRTAERLESLVPGSCGKLSVIYNAVDHDSFFAVSQAEALSNRAVRGLEASRFVFLLPGRMEPQKGHMILIRAAISLATESEFILVFAGKEIDTKLKSAIVRELEGSPLEGRVEFWGFQRDMRAVYSVADVMVLPSLWEGLPNVVLEAMACECPVIASAVGDNAVLVKPDRGMLVDVNSEKALRGAMVSMLRKAPAELEQMGRRGRIFTKATCSRAAFAQGYVRLLENFAGEAN